MSLKKVALFIAMTVCFCQSVIAQSSFWDGPDAYLGQPRPSDTPRIFAPGMLVDPGTFAMGRVAFSQDGKEFYYTQSTSWTKGSAWIKMVRYSGHNWGHPAVIAEQLMSPTLSIDGSMLYMRKGGMKNVWLEHRTADGWSAPTVFLEKQFGLYDFMPTLSGNDYIGSDPDADDVKNGIAYSFSVMTVAGNDVKVKSLGRPINEPGFNGDLYVAPDESYMIVSAKESATYESELYISFHKADGTWTQPVSLGPKINDGVAHRWGQYVSPDGKYLFYSHGTSEKDCAVLWVRFDRLLKSLRPKS
jgi:hypothetical protein